MKAFVGEANGGPLNGQSLAHWSQTIKLYRPMVAMTLNIADAPVEPVEIGQYELDDFGRWNWRATELGKSFERLFDSHEGDTP